MRDIFAELRRKEALCASLEAKAGKTPIEERILKEELRKLTALRQEAHIKRTAEADREVLSAVPRKRRVRRSVQDTQVSVVEPEKGNKAEVVGSGTVGDDNT